MITVIPPKKQRIKMLHVVTPHVSVIAYPALAFIGDWYSWAMIRVSSIQIK